MAKIDSALIAAMKELVPDDGTAIRNQRLRELLSERLGRTVAEDEYGRARDLLLIDGFLAKGMGRGGSVRRTNSDTSPGLTLEAQEIPEEAKRPKPKQMDVQAALSQRKTGEPTNPARKRDEYPKDSDYRPAQQRRNNPPRGGLAAET